jgi:hypothetical protein
MPGGTARVRTAAGATVGTTTGAAVGAGRGADRLSGSGDAAVGATGPRPAGSTGATAGPRAGAAKTVPDSRMGAPTGRLGAGGVASALPLASGRVGAGMPGAVAFGGGASPTRLGTSADGTVGTTGLLPTVGCRGSEPGPAPGLSVDGSRAVIGDSTGPLTADGSWRAGAVGRLAAGRAEVARVSSEFA